MQEFRLTTFWSPPRPAQGLLRRAVEPDPGGLAAYGFVALGPTGVELRRGKGIVARGEGATVNVAEYGAALRALRWLVGEGRRRTGAKLEALELLSDSQLLICQLTGEHEVRSPLLFPPSPPTSRRRRRRAPPGQRG